jgi:leucyl aminopeptidase
VLSKAHDSRNRTEYEGIFEVDERLVSDLVAAARRVAEEVKRLPPIQRP